LRKQLRTHDEMLALFAARTDLGPELRSMLETCERCWSVVSWDVLAGALDVCVMPGLPRERYQQARRLAEAQLAQAPTYTLGMCVAFLAMVRLGDLEPALALASGIPETEQWTIYEPEVRAGRALALSQLGRIHEAQAELTRLAELAAAAPDAPHAVALWREVTVALAK
jgi:hypothetical protein